MTTLPTERATLAHVRKGGLVRLGNRTLRVGGRPKPGFAQLEREGETVVAPLSMKVEQVVSGKLH